MLEDICKAMEEKMEAVLDVLRTDFASIRTGRASVTLVEKIKVSCYNTTLPLNQVATITVPDIHQIIIQPWDKSVLQDIERAILTSDIGLTPVREGNILRLSIPPLSSERREELVRIVRKKAEEGRVALRNVRRDANEQAKKLEEKGGIPEDEVRQVQEKIQKITDDFITEVDRMVENKEKEIRQV